MSMLRIKCFIKPVLRSLLISALCLTSTFKSFAQETPLINVTLQECYRLALEQSETIAIQHELISEAEGRFQQSLSGILPKVSFDVNPSWKDDGDDIERDRTDKFVFSQPLFSGFKEFAAMAASRAQGRQRKLEIERARQILFKDVSDAFYYYLSYIEDMQALEKTRKTLNLRLNDLEERRKLGRSRPSEVASAQARLSRLEANIESVDSELSTARQLLGFLTGHPIESLFDELIVEDLSENESHYTAKAADRADVKAAHEAAQSAKHLVTAARAGHFPTVDLDGNYYTRRTGSSDSDWDVLLSISVPLFSGGQTAGLIKEKKAINRQAELTSQRTQRLAVNDIQNAYIRLRSSYRRTAALEKALAAAQTNYDLQAEDYGRSLVNNLDVLQALEDLQDARRDSARSNNGLKRAYWDLQTALGTINYDAF